jgi:hypothetical protein
MSESHGVAMLKRELLPCKYPYRSLQLVRRGPLRHRKHNVVYQLSWFSPFGYSSCSVPPPSVEVQIPVQHQVSGKSLFPYLPPIICLDLPLPFTTNIVEMIFDASECPRSAGYLNHDLRHTTNCPRNILHFRRG